MRPPPKAFLQEPSMVMMDWSETVLMRRKKRRDFRSGATFTERKPQALVAGTACGAMHGELKGHSSKPDSLS